MLELTLALLAAGAAALLVAPAFRKNSPATVDRAPFDRRIYADQLREIERDRERGTLSRAEAEAAEGEIARRLLATQESAQDSPSDGGRDKRTAIGTLFIAAFAAPAIAGAIYLMVGSPGLPGSPLAGRETPPAMDGLASPMANSAQGAESTATVLEDLAELAARLEARLAENPDEAMGWRLLATVYLRLNRIADAEEALDRAVALLVAAGDRQGAAGLQVEFGERLLARADGQITPRVAAAFANALDLYPGQPAARYYAGLARLQAGAPEEAMAIWRELLAEAPPDAPWRPMLERRIERMAPMMDLLDPANRR